MNILKKTLKKASELQAEGKREEAIEFLDNNLKKVPHREDFFVPTQFSRGKKT